MIQEDTQTDIRKLVIISIKRQDFAGREICRMRVIQRGDKEIRLPPDQPGGAEKGTTAYVYRGRLGIAMEDDEASDIGEPG